jgi:hypothetical protein
MSFKYYFLLTSLLIIEMMIICNCLKRGIFSYNELFIIQSYFYTFIKIASHLIHECDKCCPLIKDRLFSNTLYRQTIEKCAKYCSEIGYKFNILSRCKISLEIINDRKKEDKSFPEAMAQFKSNPSHCDCKSCDDVLCSNFCRSKLAGFANGTCNGEDTCICEHNKLFNF